MKSLITTEQLSYSIYIVYCHYETVIDHQTDHMDRMSPTLMNAKISEIMNCTDKTHKNCPIIQSLVKIGQSLNYSEQECDKCKQLFKVYPETSVLLCDYCLGYYTAINKNKNS